MLMRSPALSSRVRRWWRAHDGVDGAIRVGGAVAVVVTIEALAGYFLWRGITETVRIPEALGWALQFGLTGGSVVGTRAFHRGRAEDKWWGLAASLLAVGCVVFDASVAALLVFSVIAWEPGWLAVGVLVQCLAVGYLTVHTLMARPRGVREGRSELHRTTDPGWGPPSAATAPPPAAKPAPAAKPKPPETKATVKRRSSAPLRAVGTGKHVAGWAPSMTAVAREPGWSSTQWYRRRAKAVGVPVSGRTPDSELLRRVQTAELARATGAAA